MKIWLADLTYTQQIVNSDVMPASIGSIATYAESHLNIDPIRLFKYPERLCESLNREWPDIMGFSNYVWNSRLSYKFAEFIKSHQPQTVVVFGGPHFPLGRAAQEDWLRRHPAIDAYVVHEGEIAFTSLLSQVQRGLPSKGIFEESRRISILDEIPSPYVTGKLDEFFDGKLIPILQTTRGCPFQCTFCVEGMDYYTKIHRRSRLDVRAEVQYIGKKMKERGGRQDLYIADSNFGMYHDDLYTAQALADSMDHYGWPTYINATTGKNQKPRILEVAKTVHGAMRLSGSVQSLDKTVLSNVKRSNIKEQEILNLATDANDIGANSYSEIILGLPGDSRQAHRGSLKTIIDSGFRNVYTWQAMMLPGSELCTPTEREKYNLTTRYRILPRSFGHFESRGKTIAASEIEEICVTQTSLSMWDYLDCRRLHLMIAAYYNDGAFSPVLKLLRYLNVSRFQWLDRIANLPLPSRFEAVVQGFQEDTKQELLPTLEKAENVADTLENIQRFIGGEAACNLLFHYRACMLVGYWAELVDHGIASLRSLLREENHLSADLNAFVEDLRRYIYSRLMHIFDHRDIEPECDLFHDVRAFDENDNPDWRSTLLLKPQHFRFVLTPEQQQTLTDYEHIFGTSLTGVSRILMKLYVAKLYRTCVKADSTCEGALHNGTLTHKRKL